MSNNSTNFRFVVERVEKLINRVSVFIHLWGTEPLREPNNYIYLELYQD